MAYTFTRSTYGYISWPHQSWTNSLSNKLSCSLWVKGANNGTPDYDCLIANRQDGDGYGFWIERYWNQPTYWEAGQAHYGTGNVAMHSSGITTGTWVHLYVVWNGSITGNAATRGWVNGAEITWAAPDNGPYTIGTNTSPFVIGSSKNDGAGRTFEGDLAEVALWNDAITDATLISNLAAGRLPTAQSSFLTNLKFYAPLRDSTAAVYGNPGTETASNVSQSTHPAGVDTYSTGAHRSVSLSELLWQGSF